MLKEIELKYEKLINKAKKYMSEIKDYEHDINHLKDVVDYTYELLSKVKIDVNEEVCIISAYWHDVGRIYGKLGHEKASAEMLKTEMETQGFDEQFIEKCYIAIENHTWNMTPKSLEGLIVQDADKLAWIGKCRWNVCLENNQKLDGIINLLPRLKSEILHFEESRGIYDRDIVELVKILYNNKYKIN